MILVTGATGTNGVEVINQLSARAERVRALVRNPEKAAKVLPPETDIARGDLDDPRSLEEAMSGVDSVFLLCPVDQRQPLLEANAIDAARKAGVRRIVKLSVINASPESTVTLERWHGQTEKRIRESGLGYTFLRPNMFMQELLRQKDSMCNQGEFYFPFGDAKVSLTDVRDIAAAATEALTSAKHEGKTYETTGPESLSMSEVAVKVSALAHRPVRYVPVTIEVFKSSFLGGGIPQWMADVLGELFESIAAGNNARVGDGVEKATGRAARDLDQFVRDQSKESG